MIYTPTKEVILTLTYGSHLYGTSTPTSDYDFKCITLPSYRDLILAKPLRVLKYKYDKDGNPVAEDASMPADGYEAEYVPLHKLVHDYLGGQAYAVEFVYGALQGAADAHLAPPATSQARIAHKTIELCRTLSKDFLHQNVNGMTGFAMKQTFDYVRRGERYSSAVRVLSIVDDMLARHQAMFEPVTAPALRLDSQWSNPPLKTVLDAIVELTGLDVGSSVNQNKTMRTLKLNGREYLETTTLLHFRNAVEKLVDQYGERSTKAAETDVDWKSLSHAVRVYEQVIELFDTGWITFPRPNAKSLLRIKQGQCQLEVVKQLLRDLDDEVNLRLAETTFPVVNEVTRQRADSLLFDWLQSEY
jgi:hypothetical protein